MGKIISLCLLLAAITAMTWLLSASATASYYVNCGNPPNWSGKLLAHRIGCPGARKVFKNVRCSNADCSQVHSGNWTCTRHRVNEVTAVGVCHLGGARVRWRVYE
jgi:hypothetical protein